MMQRLGLTRDQVGELHKSMMALIAATEAATDDAAGDLADAWRCPPAERKMAAT